MTNFMFEIDYYTTFTNTRRNLFSGVLVQLIISSFIVTILSILIFFSFAIMICRWKHINSKSIFFSLKDSLTPRRWIVMIHYLHFFLLRIIVLVLIICFKDRSTIKWFIVFGLQIIFVVKSLLPIFS